MIDVSLYFHCVILHILMACISNNFVLFSVFQLNLLFLLNIIRVLVLKLNDDHSNEAQVVKVR